MCVPLRRSREDSLNSLGSTPKQTENGSFYHSNVAMLWNADAESLKGDHLNLEGITGELVRDAIMPPTN